VLATGNRASRPSFLPNAQTPEAQWVVDAWQPTATSDYPAGVRKLPPDSTIVIIGTGLTMVDTVQTLEAQGYRGSILAISRHGWLPAVHEHPKPYPAWTWTRHPAAAPRTALGLLQGLRAEIEQAATLGYDWRSVIDSLRPITQTLWQQLEVGEKRKFMRRLFTLWNVHRHRVAPAASTELLALQQRGRLQVVAGKICQLNTHVAGLKVAYYPASTSDLTVVNAALVINCTGPTYDSTVGHDELLANLHSRGLLTRGPLGMGVAVDSQGRAKNNATGAIFPMGSLLVGELLECTAIPELRNQAQTVARHLLAPWGAPTNSAPPVAERVPV
ncbi:MAG: hypothetical protein KF832_25015, partial [Caldilineaceae bacterium]|nr:hypothetical protein [Caldilineaceae bacterium]